MTDTPEPIRPIIVSDKELYRQQSRKWRRTTIVMFIGFIFQLVINVVVITRLADTVNQVDCNNREAIQELVDQFQVEEEINVLCGRDD